MGLSLSPVLTSSDLERIHSHSLDLLERVGFDYKTPNFTTTNPQRFPMGQLTRLSPSSSPLIEN